MLCLKVPTDAAWAADAVRDVDAMLVDHAHCELKAAWSTPCSSTTRTAS
jgi:tRNA-(ms[2]io[6]A)-hydroxylase